MISYFLSNSFKMNLLNESNKELIDFFHQFSHEEDFEEKLAYLEKISVFKLKGEILLGDVVIPEIGPDNELQNFLETVSNWSEESKKKIEFALNLYENGNLTSLEEAIMLIEILKINNKDKVELLDKIKNDLAAGELRNFESYSDLLMTGKDTSDALLFGNLLNFLVGLAA